METLINNTWESLIKAYLLVLLFVSAGCYSVTVISPEETKVERGLGIVKININPNANSFFTEFTGIGISSTPMGTSIGFTWQELAAVTDSCKLIVWIKNKRELENLIQLIGDRENVCVLNSEQMTNRGGI